MIYTALRVPRWLRDGIKPNHKGARMDKIIYGADTETCKGEPNTLQFYSEDVSESTLQFVNTKNAREKFIKWCDGRRPRVLHVVYIHNLSFDIVELFWGLHGSLIGNGGEFHFTCGQWEIKGLYGTPTFCSMSSGNTRRIILVDSYSFYRGSLASASELFCPNLPKMRRPRDLGERRYTSKDTGFAAYAMRDAVISYHIGKSIEGLHREFDLSQCISVADMACRIFRHHYLTYTIPQPDAEISAAALDSYHGGKNNVTARAGWYPGITGVDISSAYPDAMCQLPAFSNGLLYRRFRRHIRPKRVPPFGVYRVDGCVSTCKWPSLFDAAFKPLSGVFERVHIQGFEVNEALRSGELQIKSIDGWYYDEDKDRQQPALTKFCKEFYARKQKESDPVKRYGVKTILNSISGKFIQTRKRRSSAYVDIDTGKTTDCAELVAGGMFHPFIASAITAHTRARIHALEHKYTALHTATDGIFTQDVMQLPEKGQQLGDLVAEVYGTLLMLRNKCYIVYGSKGFPSKAFEGKQITKYAMHGFQGTVYQLEQLAASGQRRYTAPHVNRLKESIKRGLTPNEFVKRDYILKVGPLEVHNVEKM
jgi:DNA polymerase type B, organellar and viral